MATYVYETITAAQALAILPTDNIVSQRGIGNPAYAAEIEHLAATASEPARVAITLGGQTVVFGTNVLTLSQNGAFIGADEYRLTIGGAGADTLTGYSFNRAIHGVTGDDKLAAEGDGDVLYGGGGADSLVSGSGFDTMIGGDGDDRIFAGAGEDSVDGGADDDVLVLNGASSDYIIVPLQSGGVDIYDQRLAGQAGNRTQALNIETLRFNDRDSSARNIVWVGPDAPSEAREGDAGLTAHGFTAMRTGDLSAPLTVTWRATTSNGADLDQTSGQATFAANSASASFVVYTRADTVIENDEAFEVRLEPPGSWTFNGSAAQAVDINDDGRTSSYSIALQSEALAEGHSGPTAHTFTVTRTGFTSIAGSVSFAVAGTGAHAASAADFVSGAFPAGTVEFAAGQTTRVLTIQVQGDGTVEADEGFTVTLSPYTFGDQIGTATASATIYNDEYDRPPEPGDGGSAPPPTSAAPEEPKLIGDAEPDTIQGTAGADTIGGGNGVSYLRGAEGDDIIIGGVDFDDINGNQGADTASGGDGDDWVVGGKDGDFLTGDGGNDIINGNLGDDTCEGGDGADIVRGGQQNDLVRGGAGDDWLSGDRGDDTLTGGAGADIFHSFGGAGIDRVLDFNRAEGDRVQLDPGTVYTVSQVGADTVIQMEGGGQVILVGVAQSSLAGDWIFGA